MPSEEEFKSAMDQIETQLTASLASAAVQQRPAVHVVRPAETPELSATGSAFPVFEETDRSLHQLLIELEARQDEIAVAIIERLERIERFLGVSKAWRATGERPREAGPSSGR
jgi:hypothetical protein